MTSNFLDMLLPCHLYAQATVQGAESAILRPDVYAMQDTLVTTVVLSNVPLLAVPTAAAVKVDASVTSDTAAKLVMFRFAQIIAGIMAYVCQVYVGVLEDGQATIVVIICSMALRVRRRVFCCWIITSVWTI